MRERETTVFALPGWLPWSSEGSPSEAKGSGIITVDGLPADVDPLIEGAAARGLEVHQRWSRMPTGEPTTGVALKEWVASLPFKVAGVLAIQDHVSLPLAEELLELAGLCGGSGDAALDDRLRRARCNKFLMQEEVARAGLAAVAQRCARSPSEVRAFAEAQESRQVVMKPFFGMGGVNVTLLDYSADPQGAEAAVNDVFAMRPPDASEYPVLVQEYVEGNEYSVDMVAREGHIVVTNVQKYDRRPVGGAAFVFFSTLLRPVVPESEEEDVALYAMKVMAALGVRNGPAHVEVKHSARHGPVLVEFNAHRFNGAQFLPEVVRRAVGYNQRSVFLDSVDASVSAEAWRARYPVLPPPELKAFGGDVDLHVWKAGIYAGGDEAALAELQSLPSVFAVGGGPAEVRAGEWMPVTRDKSTVPARLGFCSPSEEAMMADYRRVFEIEARMFATS